MGSAHLNRRAAFVGGDRQMTEKFAKDILRKKSPAEVGCLLILVNLTEGEEQTIKLCEMKGLTLEKAAERMERGRNTVQRWHEEGMRKIIREWSKYPWINHIFDDI